MNSHVAQTFKIKPLIVACLVPIGFAWLSIALFEYFTSFYVPLDFKIVILTNPVILFLIAILIELRFIPSFSANHSVNKVITFTGAMIIYYITVGILILLSDNYR